MTKTVKEPETTTEEAPAPVLVGDATSLEQPAETKLPSPWITPFGEEHLKRLTQLHRRLDRLNAAHIESKERATALDKEIKVVTREIIHLSKPGRKIARRDFDDPLQLEFEDVMDPPDKEKSDGKEEEEQAGDAVPGGGEQSEGGDEDAPVV